MNHPTTPLVRLRGSPLRWAAGAACVAAAVTAFALGPHDAFLAENDAAMERMMAAMVIKPSGDVDRDFAEMMIPHHQGAIDMAVAEIRYGRNEQLRRIAQEIIVDQQQEIAAMRLALGDPAPTPHAAPTQPLAEGRGSVGPQAHHHHHDNHQE